MIRRLAHALSRWSARYVPAPLTIAVLLTIVTFVLVWAAVGIQPLIAVGLWGGRLQGDKLLGSERGLWTLLTFAMQVCLTLVTGHALASAPLVSRAIGRLARLARTPTAAIVVTALTAMVAGLLNWALGLIVGALMARDMARVAAERGVKVHYPLLGAAGYTGLLVWHGGLSGSAPLKVTQAKEIADIMPGVQLQPITLDQTTFSPLNLLVTATLLLAVPAILVAMHPPAYASKSIIDYQPDQADQAELTEATTQPPADTPAAHLDQSPILALILAAAAGGYLFIYLRQIGLGKMDLNSVNLAFMTAGLLLHKSLKAYGRAISHAASACAGVIMQFPLYAGIMGLMALSGLMAIIATEIGELASPSSFGAVTFLSAGVVNLLVPSGGGQWAIQGPIVVKAAHHLGVPMGKAVMAFCYGDQWTNMLQPFWALPLLGITGLKVGDVIGYTTTLMLLVAPIFLLALVLM